MVDADIYSTPRIQDQQGIGDDILIRHWSYQGEKLQAMRKVDLNLGPLYDIEYCSSSSTRFAMVIAQPERCMRRVPDDDHTGSQSDVHSLHQVLPVEDDLFTAPSLTPHIEDFETIWQNSALKTTIGDPPLYLCLPDYELTDTMIIFFDTITEILSVPQNEFVRICWTTG